MKSDPNPASEIENDTQIAENASIYAPDAASPHRTVAFHGVMGLRVFYDIETQRLDLWINPQAGKSTDINLRNFSNRDNHTALFDEIFFPRLTPASFRRCEYDPLHSVLHFENARLHLAQDPSVCGVRVWCEGAEQVVDLKSDKQDFPGIRDKDAFSTSHPDRGLAFVFAAVLGDGDGTFWHAPVIVRGRSVWVRAKLAPGQVLAITGELATEPVLETARSLAASSDEEFLRRSQEAAGELQRGHIRLGGAFEHPRRMERVIETNRSVIWTAVDASGIFWDGPRHIYYLPWVRAGLSIPLAAWAGMANLSKNFARFALDNPTRLPDGRMYGQLFGPLSKWQEDGLFYVVGAAHAASIEDPEGDWFRGTRLQTQIDALDWLDRYCWDEEKSLYWRHFACETPFEGSRDYGWDAPVGIPTEAVPMRFQGKVIRRTYDIYVNCLQYAVLRMLAPHVDAERRKQFLNKAARIDSALDPLWEQLHRGTPPYGWVVLEDGSTVLAAELDWTDHIWGACLPLITPPSMPARWIRSEMARRASVDIASQGMSKFLFAYTIPWLAADPLDRPAQETVRDIDALLTEIEREPRFQRSPGAVPECVGVEDGHLWHDVRPCAFASGQWIPLFHSLGLRRHHLSWSLRGGNGIDRISDMPLGGGAVADIAFQQGPVVCGVTIDGVPLQNTLVLPWSALTPGHHKIEVGGEPCPGPILVATDARLLDVSREGEQVRYRVWGYGPHRLEFADGTSQDIELDGEMVV